MLDDGLSPKEGLEAWIREGGSGSFGLSEAVEMEYEAQIGRLRFTKVVEGGDALSSEPVGWGDAERKALDVLSALATSGMIGAMQHEQILVTRGGHEGSCAEETPECRVEVDAHRFTYAPTYAGIPVPGAPVEIVVGRDGELRSFLVGLWDFENEGAAFAEISEEGVRERLVELVDEQSRGEEVHWEEEGRLEYLLPVREPSASMEPVLYGRFIIGSGRPVETALPLSDADAPLE